jgi:hypothetical protein
MGQRVSNNATRLLDDASHADVVDLMGFDDGEPTSLSIS